MFVDCGSAISLISSELYQQISAKNNKIKLYPSSTKLQTVNKSPLNVLGQVNLNLDIEGTSRKDGRCSTSFQFYIAESLTHHILIGMDFLQTHRAVVDTGRKRLTIINNYGTETIHKLHNTRPLDLLAIAEGDIADANFQNRGSLQKALRDGKQASRGLIVPGERIAQQLTPTIFDCYPVPILAATVRYYRTKVQP